MSVFSALYHLLIGPIELVFELIFAYANRFLDHPGLSIIFLSLAMNFMVLPLYKRADAMQAEERETEERLGYWVKHIKKNFTGDERYMMLQTYYRQNGYKPTYALKGSVSLLLEIPFFIAAYNFLSGLELLQGVSFGPIADLSAPDGLITLGGLSINVLPVLMTLINLVSGAIYTKGLPLRSKVQLYTMAGLFLVLLYQSPSGLVFYWTLNNIFSLVKNIFYRLKNPRLVLSLLSSAVSAVLLVFVLFVHPLGSARRQVFAAVLLLMLQLPLLILAVKKSHTFPESAPVSRKESLVFYGGAVLLATMTGLLIPSAVIRSSPEEFINTITYVSPLQYVWSAALLSFGTFLVLFGIFYMLAAPAGKRLMGLGMWLAAGAAVVDYMFFGEDYGTLSPDLSFVHLPAFPLQPQLINAAVLLAVLLVLALLWKKKQELVRVCLLAACIAVTGMSGVNLLSIDRQVSPRLEQLRADGSLEISIPISREGKNVVVLMLDRAIGGYVPYLMNEKPELLAQFDGFTYYPNTISYGGFTNFGSPGLFGGYEYTPEEMNKRESEPLAEKHNEAMKVMPVLFSRSGFDVTVCNPTYAGYTWIPDLSIYDEYPEIHRYNSLGRFMGNPEELAAKIDRRLHRNFFCYSVFKVAPLILQPTIYNCGQYNALTVEHSQVRQGISQAEGLSDLFMKPYTDLEHLKDMTKLIDAGSCFTMMSNDTTHEPMLLQEPEYVPAQVVDNREYDAAHSDRFTVNGVTLRMENDDQVIHYHANMASFLQLGKWFDYLRSEGVYDNTRIILVSDHGRALGQLDSLIYDEGLTGDGMFYNPLLMVKDFGAEGFRTDNRFMTNADVPYLATSALIETPTNPFTGKLITDSPKMNGEQKICTSLKWNVADNHGNTFADGGWTGVQENIFDPANWRTIVKEQE